MAGLRHLIRVTCCAVALAVSLAAIQSRAADAPNMCARASLTNPDASFASAGGMGGTGAVAGAGGIGGTGSVAGAGGIGGTGSVAGAGGIGGTGSVAGAGGVGGTGSVAGAGGIGGTGTVAEVVPGTGGMGGTGIVGVITGFASICVNGVEVHYDAKTPVSVNGQPGAPRDLAVGQVVAVHARAVGGQLQANGIGVIDAVAGPVTRVNPTTRELQVMGQTVRTDAATGASLSTLRVGDVARVSGHRSENGDVIATRIDTAARGAGASTSSLLGTVSRVDGDNLIVNGSRVAMGARGTQGLTAGSEVFVSGDWNGTALQARRVDAQPVRNAIARSERAIIEGYVRSKSTRELNVGGVSVRIDNRVRYNGGNDRDADVGRKVQVEVRRSGNDWLAERVMMQRDDRPSRSGRVNTGQSGSTESSREGSNSGSSESGNAGSENSGSGNSNSGSSGSGSSGSGSSNSGNSGSGSSGVSGGSGSSDRSGSSGSSDRSSGSGSSGGSGRSSGSGSGSGSGSSRGSRR